ncbi:MAG: hypothetical protein CVT99_09145 [Bacteroidetes bacterium HGW-Bacteroidetes-16]|jgi:hypothetical protein|nr:MAG: hypothetical protein CVT99_09145 [Bacteroidetes bacterium HGW-Bacteroidetes-16]
MRNLILILVIIPSFLFGQGWERTYGGDDADNGWSVQQTTDLGYIITGYTKSFGNGGSDVYLIKTDNNGDTIWTKTYGSLGDDYGHSVKQTTDNGYIITGNTWSTSNSSNDVFLIKTDSNGDTLWTRTIDVEDYDKGYSVQQATDGGYIITGFTKSFGNSTDKIFLIKTEGNGNTMWTKTFNFHDSDIGHSVQQTTDGGYIITGGTYSIDSDLTLIFLIKTDSNGDTLWTKTYGGDNNDYGYSVQQTMDGGYIITGCTASFGNGMEDVYLIKTDVNGDTLWTKTFGDEYDNYGLSVQQTTDEGYIITGGTVPDESGLQNVYLIKTNSNGDAIWSKTFGGEERDVGLSVQQAMDEGYIITGYNQSNNITNVYLIKTDKNGIITFTTEIPVPNPNRKLIKKVDISGNEIHTPKTNQPYIEIYDDGTTQKKMK